MSAPDLHTAIKVADHMMTTSGAALGSAPITAVLIAYLGSDSLTLHDAEIISQPGDAFVTVHGVVQLFGVAMTGDFRFFLDGETAHFEFTGTPPAGWTLGQSFPSLVGSSLGAQAFGTPKFDWRSDGPSPGATIGAGYTLPPPLEIIRWFVAPEASARIAGSIALQQGAPLVALTVSPTMKASLGGYVDIDLTLEERTVVAKGTGSKQATATPITLLNGDLGFTHSGKPVKVPMQAALNAQVGVLKLQMLTGQLFDLALDEIAGWIDGIDLSSSALPSQYRPAAGLTLHDVTFAIGLRAKALEYVSLSVVSTQRWPIVDKLSIEPGITLTFVVRPSGKPKLLASIEGTLQLGTAAALTVYAQYPDFQINGHLADNSPIDLGPVLSYMGAVGAGLPSTLQIDVLQFSAHPSGSSYSFEIDVVGDWAIVKALAITGLQASLSYQGAALNLLFAGSFLVGGVDLAISAEYDSDSGGWLFSGRAAQSAPIQIGQFVKQLATDFSSSAAQLLPDFIASLEIEAISITFDTATKDFEFSCETLFDIDGTPLDLTLHISLKNDGKDGYTHLFSGRLMIGSLAFELAFEDAKSGAASSSTFLAAVQPSVGVDIRTLVANVNAGAGALMPDLTLTLENAMFLYRRSGNDPANYLFGLAIGVDLDLSVLPLVGPVIKDFGLSAVKDVQALYAAHAVSADDVAAFNALLGDVGAKPPLPVKKGITGTSPVLDAGFNFAATLDFGDGPTAVTAGGATAPPNPSSNPPTSSQPLAPPSGNASWFDIKKAIGPATLDRIGVRYQDGRAWLLFDADFTLSGLQMGLRGLALGTKLDDPAAIAVNLDGMSISFASGPLTIDGGFLHLGNDYLGMARVQAATFGLTAIGGYAPADESFFIFARLTAPLGGPPFFFITGIAAGFGINRSLIVPPIDDLTQFALLPANNKFPATLGQSDPGGTLASTLASTESYIHPMAGENWAAAGLDFTSFEMVDSSALVTVAFGVEFSLALLGICRVTVPKLDPEPIVYLEIALEAQLKPSIGLFAVDGRLTPASFLYAKLCRITGGFAFYFWFDGDHAGEFVISVGGYHPNFKRPDFYPVVPRLQLSYQIGDLVITGQSYLALTSHMVMAGIRIDATWNSGSLSAWFNAGMDFLLGWRPFHYEADAYVHIGVSLTIDLWFTSFSITIHVGVDLNIWGPPFGGQAVIDLDIVSFTISFGADPRTDAVDWAGFASGFLPTGSDKSAAPARLFAGPMLLAEKDAAEPSPSDTLWCTASVINGLAKDLKAADDTAFFSWLVDANHFVLAGTVVIPAKAATYNAFDLQMPFKTDGGFIPAKSGDTPTAAYDTTRYPDGIVWSKEFGVLPMQLAAADFVTHLTVQLARAKPGSDHTVVANYVDAINDISVTPVLKAASAALWAGTDPGLNGARLVNDALVGLQLTPMAQHPDITFKADLWAMLFDHSHPPITWQAVVPAADTSDSYGSSASAGTLKFTLAGEPVTCSDYELTAIALPAVAATRSKTVAGLAALGLALDPAAIDVSTLATYPLWDWPAIRTLGEERAA